MGMFGCVRESIATGNFLLGRNKSAMDLPPPSDIEVPLMLGQLEGHPKILYLTESHRKNCLNVVEN